jgi:predicted RNA-binding Zn ribbon-like protein
MEMTPHQFAVTSEDFVFFGEFLVIDFLNTEIIRRRKRYDLIHNVPSFMLWGEMLREHYGTKSPVVDAASFVPAIQLRSAIRQLFEHFIQHSVLEPSLLEALNDVLRQAHPVLVSSTHKMSAQIQYVAGSPLVQSCLLPLVLSVVELFTQHDLRRLRQCRNEHCILFFYDTSKNGTREWCSSACMNRARSAAHYRKSKEDHR